MKTGLLDLWLIDLWQQNNPTSSLFITIQSEMGIFAIISTALLFGRRMNRKSLQLIKSALCYHGIPGSILLNSFSLFWVKVVMPLFQRKQCKLCTGGLYYSETIFSETKTFYSWPYFPKPRLFTRKNSPKPKPSKNWQKSRNRNVTIWLPWDVFCFFVLCFLHGKIFVFCLDVKGLASQCSAKTTFTFHFSVINV